MASDLLDNTNAIIERLSKLGGGTKKRATDLLDGGNVIIDQLDTLIANGSGGGNGGYQAGDGLTLTNATFAVDDTVARTSDITVLQNADIVSISFDEGTQDIILTRGDRTVEYTQIPSSTTNTSGLMSYQDKGTLNNHTTQINTLSTTVGDMTAQINDAQSDIQDLQNQVGTIIPQLQEQITELQQQVIDQATPVVNILEAQSIGYAPLPTGNGNNTFADGFVVGNVTVPKQGDVNIDFTAVLTRTLNSTTSSASTGYYFVGLEYSETQEQAQIPQPVDLTLPQNPFYSFSQQDGFSYDRSPSTVYTTLAIHKTFENIPIGRYRIWLEFVGSSDGYYTDSISTSITKNRASIPMDNKETKPTP